MIEELSKEYFLFFYRSSGPEREMKWSVDETVFEARTHRWMDKIKLNMSYFKDIKEGTPEYLTQKTI